MGKILEFKSKAKREEIQLTEEEQRACKVAKDLRELFSDKQVEAMRKEFEADVPES
jgi:hypothetical protein